MLELVDERPGYLALRASGRDAVRAFQHEAGGHRVQRIPPTEKRGRVHSSTITIAVLEEPTPARVNLREEDLEIQATRGSGAGGQHRNKTSSAIQILHRPTGLRVRVEAERSQAQNKSAALSLLAAKLLQRERDATDQARAADRRAQLGRGERGDKRRTVAFQRDQVIDHETGRTTTAARYRKGFLDDLWP